tara:strand:+ start:3985 stop:7137 length:3153 start_codon:yes stop_codon:yes gene_type:complete
MRSKEERKALHRTPSRSVRTDSKTKASDATKITKDGGRVYEETTVDGQKFYKELKTNPEASISSTSPFAAQVGVSSNGGLGTAGGEGVTQHSGLSGIGADDHHPRQHSLTSTADHTGTLSVAMGGTGVTSSTGTTNTVLSTSPTFETSITIDQDNGEPALVLHRDGANPSASSAIGRIKFNQDYDASAEEWGRIQLQTTDSNARTKLGLWVKQTGGNIAEALTILGHDSGSNVGIATTAPDKTLEINSGANDNNHIRLSYNDANGSASVYSDISCTSGGNLVLAPTGDITLKPAGNDVLPDTSYSTSLGSSSKKILSLYAAQLKVDNLIAADVMSTIGGRILVAPTTELIDDWTDSEDQDDQTGQTIKVKHNNIAQNDILWMESGSKFEAIKVTSGSSTITGGYSYTVTRGWSNTGSELWYKGDAVVNTGANPSGSGTQVGFIDLYSDHSVTVESGSGGTQGDLITSNSGPTILGNVRTGDEFYNYEPMWAIGNLDGHYGQGNNVAGVGLGKYSAEHILITSGSIAFKDSTATKMDITGGNIRIYKDNSDTVVSEWDSETIHLGNQDHEHIEITSTSLKIIDDETDRVVINSSGITIGKFSADASGDITVDDISLNGMITATGTGGRKNVCIGTGNSDLGNTNICIGVNAGNDLTSYADRNIFIGEEAGSKITGTSAVNTGDDNICIGYKSGSDADQVETTIGRRNIYIGTSATGGANNTYNEVAIGYNITGKGNDTVNIGGPDTTQFWLGTDADTSVYNMNGKIMTGRAEVTSTNSTSTDATICLFRGTGRSDFAMGTETWHIVNDDSASDNFGIRRQTGGSSQVLTIAQDGSIDALCDASVDSFTFKNTVSDLGSNDVVDIWSNDSDHSISAPWYYLSCYADEDASDDREFALRGNGYGYNDGTWHANDADYAEMFEWEDGNSSNEDRRGMTVVLVGDKIRLATDSDNDNDILGIVSVQPAVLGRTKWNKWQGKYQRDKWGQVVIVDGVRQLNSDFNASTTYQPRTERKEWDAIGLLGCLRMISGQPTRSSWKKMRDIQDNIEEWFIR